jgi:hypothetical protein
MADASKPNKPKPEPCKCGLYAFPHRFTSRCIDYIDQLEEEKHQWAEHQRDLQSWAASSRG